jgi:hypothetical protein
MRRSLSRNVRNLRRMSCQQPRANLQLSIWFYWRSVLPVQRSGTGTTSTTRKSMSSVTVWSLTVNAEMSTTKQCVRVCPTSADHLQIVDQNVSSARSVLQIKLASTRSAAILVPIPAVSGPSAVQEITVPSAPVLLALLEIRLRSAPHRVSVCVQFKCGCSKFVCYSNRSGTTYYGKTTVLLPLALRTQLPVSDQWRCAFVFLSP